MVAAPVCILTSSDKGVLFPSILATIVLFYVFLFVIGVDSSYIMLGFDHICCLPTIFAVFPVLSCSFASDNLTLISFLFLVFFLPLCCVQVCTCPLSLCLSLSLPLSSLSPLPDCPARSASDAQCPSFLPPELEQTLFSKLLLVIYLSLPQKVIKRDAHICTLVPNLS